MWNASCSCSLYITVCGNIYKRLNYKIIFSVTVPTNQNKSEFKYLNGKILRDGKINENEDTI